MQTRDDSDPEARRKKLDQLCRAYWNPLFQYAKRLGNSPENAKDLTQGFFAHMLEKGLFGKAEREKGKLRTLLLTAFNFFIRGEYDKSTAEKRGGLEQTLSLDWLEESGESYQVENEDNCTPETMYEKRCALEILTAAAGSLEGKYATTGKQNFYNSLRQFITVSGNAESYAEEAAKLGIESGYYKVRVQRFRGEFKEALKAIVKETLPEEATDTDVQAEILDIIRLAYA